MELYIFKYFDLKIICNLETHILLNGFTWLHLCYTKIANLHNNLIGCKKNNLN